MQLTKTSMTSWTKKSSTKKISKAQRWWRQNDHHPVYAVTRNMPSALVMPSAMAIWTPMATRTTRLTTRKAAVLTSNNGLDPRGHDRGARSRPGGGSVFLGHALVAGFDQRGAPASTSESNKSGLKTSI